MQAMAAMACIAKRTYSDQLISFGTPFPKEKRPLPGASCAVAQRCAPAPRTARWFLASDSTQPGVRESWRNSSFGERKGSGSLAWQLVWGVTRVSEFHCCDFAGSTPEDAHAKTRISSNFPWKSASSSACQPSEAAPSLQPIFRTGLNILCFLDSLQRSACTARPRRSWENTSLASRRCHHHKASSVSRRVLKLEGFNHAGLEILVPFLECAHS